MKLYLAIKHAQNSDLYYGWLWEKNFVPTLNSMGIEVFQSQVDLAPLSENMDLNSPYGEEIEVQRENVTSLLVDELKRESAKRPFDLVLTYFYNIHVKEGFFWECKKLGIPTVNFYCNSIHQYHLVNEIVRMVDFPWFTEVEAKDKYLRDNTSSINIQMAGNPQLYYPIEGRKQNRACFIGQRYANREVYLSSLLARGFPVDIYGAGWFDTGTEKEADDKNCVSKGHLLKTYQQKIVNTIREDGVLRGLIRNYRQAKMSISRKKINKVLHPFYKGYSPNISETVSYYLHSLNFSEVWKNARPGSSFLKHVRLRDFEMPLCKTCYYTADSEEIRNYYIPDEEIILYEDVDELVEKLGYYINKPAEAYRIAEAGYQRAIREHTWESRFRELFAKVGIRLPT